MGHQQYVMTFKHGEHVDRALLRDLMYGVLHERAGVQPPSVS